MNTVEFWKNFKLATELQLSGSFIYNGIYVFDQMETFYYEEEIFEFLYNIAVGIERLQKITLILYKDYSDTNIEEFEKSLITHSHVELNSRIQNIENLKYSKRHNKFLTVLTEFYKAIRYDRYSVMSMFRKNDAQSKLIKFIEEFTETEIKIDILGCTPNEFEYKKFIGKILDRIINPIWELIKSQTAKLNIYTTEIAYESKAFKIFVARDLTFENENHVRKEILFALLHGKYSKGLKNILKVVKPVNFEMYHTNYYLRSLLHVNKTRRVLDELEEIFAIEILGYNRVKDLRILGMEYDIDHYGEEE